MDCVSRNGGLSCFLCFFLWGLRAAKGRVGRRLPVNIWTWVRAGVGQSQGSRLEKWVPLQTQALGNSACAPLTPEQDNGRKTRTDAQEGCTMATPGPSDKGGLQTERPVATPPPSLEPREGTGELRTERKDGRSSWGWGRGTGREHGLLAPIFLRGSREQSRRWPILPGLLPLRRGHSPSGYS